MPPSDRLRAWAASFAAPAAPASREHERAGALQRVVACGGFLLFWIVDAANGRLDRPRALLAALATCYLVANVSYARLLRRGRLPQPGAVYAFLLLDAWLLVAVFALDPTRFAFLYPLLFVVVLRAGLRHSVRAMLLAWAATLLCAPLVLTSAYWREQRALTLAFFFLLVLMPVFLTPLIRALHGIRSIDEERARVAAHRDEVVARSAFLAKVSHELRSPLQGIVSALDVLALRHRPGADAEDEMIQRIRRSSLLLNTHLRDLLTLAKGEAGHLDLRPEPFDAGALVETVAASAVELARDKRLKLVVEKPPGAVFVVADSARIDQILTNLVINSIRYTDAGEVRLTLHPYSVEARVLEFVVADTGPGIPEAMLPTLLAPDRTITGPARRGEGSGIGLAIVRTLVDHLGGRIAVASRVGEGTTFTVGIPAEPVDDAAADASATAIGRILVVDGDADHADTLAGVADELGFDCDCAPSLAVAANALASRRYDAAIVDVELPARGAAQLVDETRRGAGPNAATRFVAMSTGEISAAVGASFDACVRKPIDLAALRDALRAPAASASRPGRPGLRSEPA